MVYLKVMVLPLVHGLVIHLFINYMYVDSNNDLMLLSNKRLIIILRYE